MAYHSRRTEGHLATSGVPEIAECLFLVIIALWSSPKSRGSVQHPNRPLTFAIVASAQLWPLNDAAPSLRNRRSTRRVVRVRSGQPQQSSLGSARRRLLGIG